MLACLPTTFVLLAPSRSCCRLVRREQHQGESFSFNLGRFAQWTRWEFNPNHFPFPKRTSPTIQEKDCRILPLPRLILMRRCYRRERKCSSFFWCFLSLSLRLCFLPTCRTPYDTTCPWTSVSSKCLAPKMTPAKWVFQHLPNQQKDIRTDKRHWGEAAATSPHWHASAPRHRSFQTALTAKQFSRRHIDSVAY